MEIKTKGACVSFVLILDCSDDQGFCAICSKDDLIEYIPISSPSSVSLFQALEQCKERIGSIRAVLVGSGPGMFTGVRMAHVAAESIAFCFNIPLYTFSSFEKYVPEKDGPFFAAIQANKQSYYIQKGTKMGREVRWSEEVKMVPYTEIPQDQLRVVSTSRLTVLAQNLALF